LRISQSSALTIDSAAINDNLQVQNLSGSSSENTVCGSQVKGNMLAASVSICV